MNSKLTVLGTSSVANLTATSANISEESNPLTALQVEKSLGSKLSIIIDGGCCSGGKPSTILDVSKEILTLIRDGAVTRLEIESTLKRKILPIG